jgi:eukaryotic-like serine/threonine-protein kinase
VGRQDASLESRKPGYTDAGMKKADHDLLVGRTIAGKYVVENLIGSGAMGAVFRARQVALEKTVAIKVMHGENANDPAFAARFHREAKAASRLNHPNSIQILDFGAEPDGLLYIAMEYLDGRSLHHVLRDDWPLAPTRIADILMQTLAALAVAHDMGVVHRDLKPENVMVLSGTDDDGRPKDIVKVCDFGIAKITDPRAYRGNGERESEGPVTTAGFLVGTPEYMSPEQGRGEKLDPRSDLYSVGVILFEMLTRRVPFDAENAIGVVLKHITEEPPVPSSLVPDVDPRLDAIALRAMRKFREERYPSAREMRAELRLVVDRPGTARPSLRLPSPDRAAPALGNAATVAMPLPPEVLALPAAGGKPTLEGTTASVAGSTSRRRELLLIGLVVTALAVGASAMALMFRRPVHATRASVGSLVVPTAATLVPLSTVESTPPLDETAVGEGSTAHPSLRPHTPPTGNPAVHAKPASPSASGPALVVPSASAAALASASRPAPAAATPGAAPDGGPTPDPALAPTPAAAPNATPDQAPAADPGFDPEKAYVEVGMINAEGVKERAVRGALHVLGLSRCYKSALRTQGARATGVATLNLSFDESGLARSAILTGADFLPGLAHCVQEAATGLRIGKAQVDGAGGVAEVTLGFREP